MRKLLTSVAVLAVCATFALSQPAAAASNNDDVASVGIVAPSTLKERREARRAEYEKRRAAKLESDAAKLAAADAKSKAAAEKREAERKKLSDYGIFTDGVLPKNVRTAVQQDETHDDVQAMQSVRTKWKELTPDQKILYRDIAKVKWSTLTTAEQRQIKTMFAEETALNPNWQKGTKLGGSIDDDFYKDNQDIFGGGSDYGSVKPIKPVKPTKPVEEKPVNPGTGPLSGTERQNVLNVLLGQWNSLSANRREILSAAVQGGDGNRARAVLRALRREEAARKAATSFATNSGTVYTRQD